MCGQYENGLQPVRNWATFFQVLPLHCAKTAKTHIRWALRGLGTVSSSATIFPTSGIQGQVPVMKEVHQIIVCFPVGKILTSTASKQQHKGKVVAT